MYRTLCALGFEPVLRMYYHEWSTSQTIDLNGHAAVFDKIVDFSAWGWQLDLDVPEFVHWNDGHIVHPEDWQSDEDSDLDLEGDVVVWVTPVTTFNRKESAFGSLATHKYTATNVAYGDLGLFVRIGEAGERLSYPRVARPKRDYGEATSSEDEDMRLDEVMHSESQGSED